MRAFAYVAGALLAFGGGVFVGLGVNMKIAVKKHLQSLGFSPGAGNIYKRCLSLLNRMTRLIELDGAFSEDVLSDATKKEIGKILADYRKDVQKS